MYQSLLRFLDVKEKYVKILRASSKLVVIFKFLLFSVLTFLRVMSGAYMFCMR